MRASASTIFDTFALPTELLRWCIMDREVMEDNPANTKTHGNEETTNLLGKRLLSLQQK